MIYLCHKSGSLPYINRNLAIIRLPADVHTYIKHITCIHSNQFKIPSSNEKMRLVLAYQSLCEIVLFMFIS